MSYKVTWDPARRILQKIYTGDIIPDDWADANKEMFALEEGEAFRKARVLIVDYTDASMKTVLSQDVDSVVLTAHEVESINPDLVLIWIVPGKLEYGLTRVFQALTDGISWETHTVYSRQEAEHIVDEHIIKHGNNGANDDS